MLRPYLEPDQPFLDQRFPLTLDEPFTRSGAHQEGLTTNELTWLCQQGFLRRPLESVYVASQVPDSLDVRVAALRLVVPADAVVTDRTAGWLHGAEMILAPGDHLVVPKVSMFVDREGGRLRNDLSASGQRVLLPDEIAEVGGVRVTTPVRTACDLGRLLRRDFAYAALVSLSRIDAFSQTELEQHVPRFKGMRGVIQLRSLVPVVDRRAESPGEAVVVLRWLDVTAVRPELQIEVERPGRWSYWLDCGVEMLLFAVEYDGEEWHQRTDEQREHDRLRRTWLREERGWDIRPVTRTNVFGHRRDIEEIIVRGLAENRRRAGVRL